MQKEKIHIPIPDPSRWPAKGNWIKCSKKLTNQFRWIGHESSRKIYKTVKPHMLYVDKPSEDEPSEKFAKST